MKTGILASLILWILCSVVGGRKPMLPEFSFKKLSQRNTEKTFRTFTAETLLKEKKKTPNGSDVQTLKTPKTLQLQQVNFTTKPEKTKEFVFLDERGGSNTPRLDTSIDKESKLPLNSETIPSTKSTSHISTSNSAVKDSQLKNAFFKIDQNYPGRQESLQIRNNEMWRNELKLEPAPFARETHEIRAYSHSSTSSTKTSTVPRDFEDSQTPYTGVTVTMKSVGTPRDIRTIPYCSWIDPFKCPDVSKIQPSCLESPTIPALHGECKMCPFDWCFQPNDMVGSGKLHDHSPLDVVLNAGNKEPPKLALAINQPVLAKERENSNSKHARKTTEIPFWNFETFGP